MVQGSTWGGELWCGGFVMLCDALWCGVVRCGMVRSRAVWCSVMWCGAVWCSVARCVEWCSVVRCGAEWCGAMCGVVWCFVVRWCTLLCCAVGPPQQLNKVWRTDPPTPPFSQLLTICQVVEAPLQKYEVVPGSSKQQARVCGVGIGCSRQ